MNSWIKILSLLLLSFRLEAVCRFTEDTSKVYSLSGPVTLALKELELLSDSRLRGISQFHPISRNEFKGKFLPGGIFLSRELASELDGGLIFFDQSRDLSGMLRSMNLRAVEIKTRNLLPVEVSSLVANQLAKVTVGCEKKLQDYIRKSNRIASEILQNIPRNLLAVFFLGPIMRGRPPEMMMVNDGVVKWLRNEGKLKSYPSPLSYVSWSAKILNSLPKETIKIGVVDSGGKLSRKIERMALQEFNLTYPGALIPGLSQLEAWLYLIKNLEQGQ
jgi:hypothetical protein